MEVLNQVSSTPTVALIVNWPAHHFRRPVAQANQLPSESIELAYELVSHNQSREKCFYRGRYHTEIGIGGAYRPDAIWSASHLRLLNHGTVLWPVVALGTQLCTSNKKQGSPPI